MNSRYPLNLIALIVLFAVLYVVNLTGWLVNDDEGTDFYEVWQLQQGRQPGVDFAAEQQPLFLLAGSVIVGLAGRSALPLRLLATVQVLLGGLVLALGVRRVWGDVAALVALGLVLSSGLVYEQARMFRPDPMMLGWEMAGLGVLLVAVGERRDAPEDGGLEKERRGGRWRGLALVGGAGGRCWWTALAGACYGVGVLWKLFGVFPVVGVALYFLDELWRRRQAARRALREVVVAGVCFALPFLLVSVGVSAWLYSKLGLYYLETFGYHASMGQEIGIALRFVRNVVGYVFFLLVNAVFVFIIPLWVLNAPQGWRERPEVRLSFAQLLSPFVFVAISRPIHLRYFFYLIPSLAILMGWQFHLALERIGAQRPAVARFAPLVVLLVTVFAMLTTQPGVPGLLVRRESGTLALAEYVAMHTQPHDKVLADYAGINFFANRDSIYEASIVAGAQIKGGIVTGKLLIERIERDQVRMVLIHVEGGGPLIPHQLIALVDYDDFRAYLADHFDLLTVFDRAGQQIEVYQRKPEGAF